jgi:hypothetical protein
MKLLTIQFRKFRSLMLLGLCLLLFSCVSAVVGAVVGTTVEVVKVPFKVVGAAVDLAVSDDDDD